MINADYNLAAIVYAEGQDPDAVLQAFARDVERSGYRPVGLVQHRHECTDDSLLATVLHSGETVQLYQSLGPHSNACKIDVDGLLLAGMKVSSALDEGADIVIINRFGKLEEAGEGLSYLIEKTLTAGIPLVIAVPDFRQDAWMKFAEGMCMTLPCTQQAVQHWWQGLRRQAAE